MRINHIFEKVFTYFKGTENDSCPEIKAIGYQDPTTGKVRYPGTRGVGCGQIPTTGTYVNMKCADGNEYYEFTPYQS